MHSIPDADQQTQVRLMKYVSELMQSGVLKCRCTSPFGLRLTDEDRAHFARGLTQPLRSLAPGSVPLLHDYKADFTTRHPGSLSLLRTVPWSMQDCIIDLAHSLSVPVDSLAVMITNELHLASTCCIPHRVEHLVVRLVQLVV